MKTYHCFHTMKMCARCFYPMWYKCKITKIYQQKIEHIYKRNINVVPIIKYLTFFVSISDEGIFFEGVL